MKARKRFPITVKCKHCEGRGYRQATRPIEPCVFCKHDVHYEHKTEEGWTFTPGHGYDTYMICMVTDCKCVHKLPLNEGPSFQRGEWAHP